MKQELTVGRIEQLTNEPTRPSIAGHYASVQKQLNDANARVQLLAKALRFYASQENYDFDLDIGRPTEVHADNGKRAKAALVEAGITEEP